MGELLQQDIPALRRMASLFLIQTRQRNSAYRVAVSVVRHGLVSGWTYLICVGR